MRSKNSARNYLFSLILCLTGVVQASPSTFRFSHYDHASHLVPNQIGDLLQDNNGYLWLATTHGLVKFDGTRGKYFKSRANDDTSLSSNTLWDIALDNNGILWIVTHSGLNSLDTRTEQITRHPLPTARENGEPAPVFTQVTLDANNRVWLASNQGLMQFLPDSGEFISIHGDSRHGNKPVFTLAASPAHVWFTQANRRLMRLEPDTGEVHEIPYPAHHFPDGVVPASSALAAGIDDNLFVGFIGGTLLLFDISAQTFQPVDYAAQVNFSSGDRITHVLQDLQGDIWVSSEQHGLFALIAKVKNQILPDDNDPDSLRTNRIEKTYLDNQQNLWVINSGHGLSLLRQNYKNVGAINKHSQDWRRIEDNVVWGMSADAQGRLWIGTNQNGLHLLDFNNKKNKHFRHQPESPNSLSHNRVLDVLASSNSGVWVSTANGLNHYREQTDDFTRYFSQPDDPLANKLFSKIFEDNDNNIWVATLGAGAVKITPDRQMSFFSADQETLPIASNYVTSFAQDNAGHIWIGTRKGISIYRQDVDEIEHILPDTEIWSLHFDNHENNIIAGTSHGAAFIARDSHEVQWLRAKQGLAGNRVYCILADNTHYYLSTDIGLTQLARSGETKNGYWFDGFQSGYNLNGCAKDKDNRFFFAGNKGISFFQPHNLQWSAFSPMVNITAVKGYDHTQGGYQAPIERQENIQLEHDNNDLRFYFNGIYFKSSQGMTLRYRLVGLNDTWTVEKQSSSAASGQQIASHFATYTNLSPGEYRFEVQYDVVGATPSDISQLAFRIVPPWWNTVWAWLVYVCSAAGLLYLYLRWRLQSLKKDKETLTRLVHERTRSLEQMADKAMGLSAQKNHLFANVSHEFKTPLTLIMSPVDALLKQTTEPEHRRKLLSIRQHTTRLEHMVNQMLELSTLDSGPQFDKQTYQVDEVIKDVALSFSDVAKHHGMGIEIVSLCQANLHVIEDSLHKILLNLLSNAIKYGHPQTSIKLGAKCADEQLLCWVEDQGAGFSQEQARVIGDRFQRMENARPDIPGSGLGLSIVNELVEANHGVLSVTSVPGEGSKFMITFPASCIAPDAPSDAQWDSQISQQYLEELRFLDTPAVPLAKEKKQGQPRILIVEDNKQIRAMLIELLSPDYQCDSAPDGREAINLARDKHPELIISDVMMPQMDGLAMTQRLKQDETTCHIPILLLSAKSDIESRLQGLEMQADDYVGKPFHSEELKLKVDNLLSTRARLRARLATGIGLHKVQENDAFKDVNSKDQAFLEKFEQFIEQHFPDESLNRTFVAKEMAMSERQLNRKLAAICNHNFTEYLRKFRLRKSLALANKGLVIAQVSDKVGFANATYFSTCFKKEFKLTFKEYERQQQTKISAG